MGDFDNVPEEFVDVDFQQDPRFTFGDLGCVSLQDLHFGNYSDVVPTLSESEIRSAIEKAEAEKAGNEWLVTRVYNQGNEGSCVANACAQAHEIIQAAQFGKENVVHLSAISLYKRIGRSPNSGAMVSDGLDEMAKRGVLPLDNEANRAKYPGQCMPNTGFRTPYPAGWEATAAKFRGTEWHVVRSVNELLTALVCGHPVVVGRQGHSICYVRPTIRSGSISVLYVNSWGSWGVGAGDHTSGFGIDTARQVSMSAGWAFALRSVVVHTE